MTAENWQKTLGDDDVAGIASLLPGVKNLRLRKGLELTICKSQRHFVSAVTAKLKEVSLGPNPAADPGFE